MAKKVLLFTFTVVVMTLFSMVGMLFLRPVEPYHTVMAFSDEVVNIVIDDQNIQTNIYPVIQGNQILIPVSLLKDYIYSDIELSEQYNRLYVNIKSPNFKLETEELDNRIEDGINLNFLTQNIDDINYINIVGLEKIFGISVEYKEESNILIIDKIRENDEIGKINHSTYLRLDKSSFSSKLDKLSKDERVLVFEEDGKWVKIRTDKGFIGYVQKKYIDANVEEKNVDISLNEVREDWKPTGKLNLVWEYVRKYSPDLSTEQKIEGLDVISPTWFSIVDASGYVVNNADYKYSQDAHSKGYKVWGLIDNSFDKELTKALLADEKAQERAINQILIYASIYDLDGINIDFENVYYEDKDNLTSFVDKLTKALKQQNLVVSMDTTVPSSSSTWSKFYDREKLSQILDYVMVMTYDEHWAASPKSGSVASLSWVDRSIERTLEYIPKEKLIMGIPFYTREWEETKDAKGKITVKSKALSMEAVSNRIKDNNSQIVWLEDVGQNYTEYIKDGKKYRIWIEDEKSIELKSSLVYKHDLVGTASWRKGFEVEGVWTVLNNVIKFNNKLVMNRE